jgi:hypothetical protein
VASPIGQADFVLARGLFTMLGGGPDLLRQPFAGYSLEAEATVLKQALDRRKLPRGGVVARPRGTANAPRNGRGHACARRAVVVRT